ncbi:hypothetical protein [Streptomyces purpureus]|uniref:Uncharacterized protein n=1 Tax=Streptomyces purpureus TaxID=1951 RepID=A0A918HI02_9ACTN|nr:hypothetical protein [Streptomyces purpureus]GGT65839.1 hypothetical protein GCM10014713_68290 [Streptomyces purpureus]
MFSRREAVPFSFVAEADRFRSNVTPPPRERLKASQLAGRTLIGLTVVAGLVGALLFGMPAMGAGQSPAHQQQSEASHGR